MTIDEAIAHAKEVANEQKRRSGICVQNDLECDKFSSCLKCAEEREQIAEWLEELNKAIDDLSNTLKENYDYLPQIFSQEAFDRYVDEYAEQLKAGEQNEQSI